MFPIGNIALGCLQMDADCSRMGTKTDAAAELFPCGNTPLDFLFPGPYCSRSGTLMAPLSNSKDEIAARQARIFGELVRGHREARQMTQDEVALVAGVGRRFIVELEAGKPTIHLGKALAVATAVGMRPLDLLQETKDDNALLPDLPDLPDANEPPPEDSASEDIQRG
jgi:transcriptional regulator with XRE-family HTH domain